MRCERCSGTGILFKPRTMTCPSCKGAGTIPEPAKRKYSIVIVGEAYGSEEARMGMPFVGASGNELNRMLEEADIDKKDCYLTNVFNIQPQPTNDIKNLGTDRKLSLVPMPALTTGLYLQDQYFPEVKRLWKELEEIKPNLIIALGNTAMWALTGNFGIRSLRGTVTQTTYGPLGLKVIPTYHPAAVLRDWSMRAVVVADLMKAKRQSLFPEVRRPKRELWLDPTLRDIEYFYEKHILTSSKLSVDIETAGQSQITCVGFAPSHELALVIPFVDNRKRDGSYWPTAHQEKMAWNWVGKYLSSPAEKLGQNYLYDINWLWQRLGLPQRNVARDTMLKHHAINPELEKGLGFLGSVYSDEPAWKVMRAKGPGTIKRGD